MGYAQFESRQALIRERMEALKVKFPKLYSNEDLRISIDLGWFDLVDTLSSKLSEIADQHHLKLIVVQIKEKFGFLHYYWRIHGGPTPIYSSIINTAGSTFSMFPTEGAPTGDQAEIVAVIKSAVTVAVEESLNTCERCGSIEIDVKMRKDRPWIKTLCDSCNQVDHDDEEFKQHFRAWRKRQQKESKD